MSEAILLVDENVDELRRLGGDLEAAGFEVARELDAVAALAALDRLAPDVAVITAELAGGGGTSLLEALRQRGIPLIVAVEPPGLDRVAALLREGAQRILLRPLASEALVLMAREAAHAARMAQVRRLLEAEHGIGSRLDALGTQPPMRAVALGAAELGSHDGAVLLTGERGAGKTWLARLLHDTGPRAEEPFLTVNAFGAELAELESRIFGHEPGALPGALPGAERRTRGLLELAARGTLVLREVGELPLELQPLLLRAIEQRSYRRAGGRRDLPVETRLLATTSRDLAAAADEGRFRGDLLERLSSVTLRMPPLRERSDSDRRQLINRIHGRLAQALAGVPPIAPEAMDRMLEYPWPGNVAEIGHVLQRASVMAGGQPMILVEHLPGEFRARPGLGDRRHHPMSLEEVEQRQIESSLRYHGGNRTRAAKELGISRATLINKIKRYGVTE